MSGYGAQLSPRVMPTSLRWARGLLYFAGAVSVLSAIGYIVGFGADAEELGGLVWSTWPGVAALVLAYRMAGGGRKLRIWTIVVCGFWIFMGLGNLGNGDPRGFTSMIIPIIIIVLVTRRSAREYLS